MNDNAFFGKAAGIFLMLVFLAGFGGVVVFGKCQKQQRAKLEAFTVPTAFGDKPTVKLEAHDPVSPVITMGGREFYLVGEEEFKTKDGQMVKAGYDDTNTHALYRSVDAKSDELFLKVEERKYRRISSQKPAAKE